MTAPITSNDVRVALWQRKMLPDNSTRLLDSVSWAAFALSLVLNMAGHTTVVLVKLDQCRKRMSSNV